MKNKKLLFVVNDPAFFLSHRLPLALSAREDGFNVQIATMGGKYVEKIEEMGFVHHVLPLSRSGRNPINELITFFSVWRLFRQLRPDLVHLVTIKPVLYGGIAARMLKVPGVISAISGLGFLFVKRSSLRVSLLRNMALFLYRLSLKHPNQRIIFQNPTDKNLLVKAVGVQEDKIRLIRGSGVDLKDYPMIIDSASVPIVVMASRLLKDKGVHEFVEAARILTSKNIKARFQLIGEPDLGNPESVSYRSIQLWKEEGIVECLGYCSNIPELFSKAHIVTLPSYYGEGLPKVLIEAAASGCATITTDMPGCRDAIEPDITGLLVPARNVEALTQAIERLIKDSDLRNQMATAGRDLAEREFGIEKVVKAHMQIYYELTKKE